MKRNRLAFTAATIAAILSVIAFLKSGKDSESGTDGLEQFIGTEITIPHSFCSTKKISARMIVYYDSATCATCMLKRIGEWKGVFPESVAGQAESDSGFDMLFIFEPRKADSVRYLHEIGRAELPYTVISDFNGEFRNHNPNLSGDRRLHTFLLDGNGRVVLAGNPMENVLLREAYQQYIGFLTANGGEVSEEFVREVSEYIKKRSSPENGLFVTESGIDIGDIESGEQRTVTYSVSNVSGSSVEIETLITDCDCMEASALPLVIRPGKRSIITVTFTADRHGKFFRDLFIKVKGCDELTHLTVTGNCI